MFGLRLYGTLLPELALGRRERFPNDSFGGGEVLEG